MEGRIDVVLVDGFADWEPALVLAELRRSAGLTVRTSSAGGGPVTSMGGLRVQADQPLDALDPEGARLLLLPGADAWEQAAYPADLVHQRIGAYLDAGVLVAAICGATVALARGGFLAERAHTSNHREWLRAVAPDYAGADHYDVDALVVHDGGLITAAGTASTAFAAEILAALDVFDADKRRVWAALYSTGRFPPGADIAAFFAPND